MISGTLSYTRQYLTARRRIVWNNFRIRDLSNLRTYYFNLNLVFSGDFEPLIGERKLGGSISLTNCHVSRTYKMVRSEVIGQHHAAKQSLSVCVWLLDS